MNIPPQITPIIETIAKHGHQAYLVGGAVRDLLLNIPLHDFDVATDAPPHKIMEIFSGCKLLTTGLKHGTVTVIAQCGSVEITTFRSDGQYSDFRHPDAVTFSDSIESDLSRRDFTINAMAMTESIFLDPFDGRTDLHRQLIRCVGRPVERFQEDPLRILRGLRFAATLNFSIDPETADAMHRCAPLLSHIAQERITAELLRLICGGGARAILLQFSDIVAHCIPELAQTIGFDQKNPFHCYDVYGHSVHIFDHLPADRTLRLAALLHDVAKPQTFHLDGDGIGHFPAHAEVGSSIADDILRRMRIDNHTRKTVVSLIKLHGLTRYATEADLPKLLSKLGIDFFFQLLRFDLGDSLAKSPDASPEKTHWSRLEAAARTILSDGRCLALRDLAVNGTDLQSVGLQGQSIGATLNDLLDLVLTGALPNERAALLAAIRPPENAQHNK